MQKEELMQALYDAEVVAKAFSIKPFEIYLMGGSGCVVAGYFERATLDFDFIDINYSSKLNRVFKMLSPFDVIDYNLASIAPEYMQRAKKLTEFNYLNIFVLSAEDIIVSKIGRFSDKDINDIELLLSISDIKLINKLIIDVLNREDFSKRGKEIFLKNAELFRSEFNVQDS